MFKDIVVKKTKRKGLGCFVKKKFKKGTYVIDMVPGRIVRVEDDQYITPRGVERWDYCDPYHYYFMSDPEAYINHSCNPNVYIKNMKVYAWRDIKKGEELLFDYSINGIDGWTMDCKCGSKNCRKKINGKFFKLPKKRQKEYLPYLENWFLKHFKKKLAKLR